MSQNQLLKLKADNFIHPTAVIDPSVQIGFGNYIGPYCVIGAHAIIGNNNRFEAMCSIALAPEHKDYWHGNYKSVVIGNSGVYRENITIHSGTTENTYIGNDVVMLSGSYAGHDSFICDGVTLSCGAKVGGHSLLFKGANLGLNVSVHQYSIIGHYSMLGMSTVVTKKSRIEPFNTYVGKPARFLKKNSLAIERNALTPAYMENSIAEFNLAQQEKVSIAIPKLIKNLNSI